MTILVEKTDDGGVRVTPSMEGIHPPPEGYRPLRRGENPQVGDIFWNCLFERWTEYAEAEIGFGRAMFGDKHGEIGRGAYPHRRDAL